MKILFVDDQPHTRLCRMIDFATLFKEPEIVAIIKDSLIASNIEAVRWHLQYHTPTIIMMDGDMPECSGVIITEQLFKDPETRATVETAIWIVHTNNPLKADFISKILTQYNVIHKVIAFTYTERIIAAIKNIKDSIET